MLKPSAYLAKKIEFIIMKKKYWSKYAVPNLSACLLNIVNELNMI